MKTQPIIGQPASWRQLNCHLWQKWISPSLSAEVLEFSGGFRIYVNGNYSTALTGADRTLEEARAEADKMTEQLSTNSK